MAEETAGSFSKTICPICVEDLKPTIEDLQAISVCGHVFHELCLQQWFEYCPRGNQCSYPVCKQVCASGNVNRLHFQSIPGRTEPSEREELVADVASLHGEVTRLIEKLSEISSVMKCQANVIKQLNKKKETSMRTDALVQKKRTIQRQAEELKQLNEKLHICRNQLKNETWMRNNAVDQKRTIC